jgi:membrane fusion protein, multidrug efflux system
MKARLWGAVGFSLLWLASLSCSKTTEGKKSGEGVRPPVAVEAALVQAKDLIEGIDVVGSLTPKFEAKVKSEYAGIVNQVYVTEWVLVKKGTPLARLDTREIDAIVQKAQAAVEASRANLLQAEVAANRAQREWDRAQRLKEVGLITLQNLEDAQTEKAAAGARIAAAQAQLAASEKDLKQAQTRMAKSTIYSPMDGVVALRNVNVGDLVGEMGSPKIMFQIVDNSLLDLTVTVPSNEMGRLQTGQVLTFSTDAFPGRVFTGQVKFINPAVSEGDRSVKLIAEVRNVPEVLKGGLFVKGRIITGQRKNVLQVPRLALLSWEVASRKGEVFLIEGESAHRRTIQTGSLAGDWIEVTSGLTQGQQVITRGGFNVKEGDPIKVSLNNKGN